MNTQPLPAQEDDEIRVSPETETSEGGVEASPLDPDLAEGLFGRDVVVTESTTATAPQEVTLGKRRTWGVPNQPADDDDDGFFYDEESIGGTPAQPVDDETITNLFEINLESPDSASYVTPQEVTLGKRRTWGSDRVPLTLI